MGDLAWSLLAEAGYRHYEVSNWARPGFECMHNLGYWEGRPYLGLGAGAHSYRDGRRWWNVRPPQQYLEEVEARRLPIGGHEVLTGEERRMERLRLGLRHADGVALDGLAPERLDRFVDQRLAERRSDRLVLTERGMLLANELLLEL